MSGTRPARPKRGQGGASIWEARLVAEARRVLPSRGGGPLSAAELDAASGDLIALQRGLTGERGLIGSAYMDERRRLASYLLFYWSVSRAQIRGLLSMAFGNGTSGSRTPSPLRILDLGSGPAPCSIAAAEWFGAEDVRIVACDRSETALASGRRLAESSGYAFTGVDGWDAVSAPPPAGPFDLIILGHVLNELWKGRVDRIERRLGFMRGLLDRLADGGAVIVLEPATLEVSRDMLTLRDLLAVAGISILAPCFRNGPCPALAQGGQSCHSDFLWKPNAIVRELSLRTGLDKGIVKTAGFVFVPDGRKNGEVGTYRVVSEPMLNKAGRLRVLICGEEGRFPLSAKKGEGFPAETAFRELARSDRIDLSDPVRRESGLALGAKTKITRASPATI